MSIPWFAALDPLIDDGVNECDVLFIRDRPIRQKVAFTIILFAAYLKRTGDFASAFRLYTSLLRWKPLKAEGHLGLADISHLLADWKLELAPYKAEGIYPNPSLAAEGDTQDYVWRMDEFSHEDAQNHYQIASEELPASAFPLLHLSKVLISQGNMHEAMKVIDKAADLAADNRLVELNRAYVHGLTGQSGWEDI